MAVLRRRCLEGWTHGYSIIVGEGGAWILTATIPSLRTLINQPAAPPHLVAVQVWRVVGISFVILLGLVNLPALFALPTGLGEITAGLNGRTSSAFKHTRAKAVWSGAVPSQREPIFPIRIRLRQTARARAKKISLMDRDRSICSDYREGNGCPIGTGETRGMSR